jgi:hypothetical protein
MSASGQRAVAQATTLDPQPVVLTRRFSGVDRHDDLAACCPGGEGGESLVRLLEVLNVDGELACGGLRSERREEASWSTR